MLNQLRKRLKYSVIDTLKWLLSSLGVRTVEREGVFVAIRHPDDNNLVLLVKNKRDGSKWSMPGGGIKQGWFAIDAATEEVLSETGLLVDINPNPIAHLSFQIKYGFYLLFEGKIIGGSIKESGNGDDVIQCRYFHIDRLPHPIYNAQKGNVGWMLAHKDGGPVLYGAPNKPPVEKYRTD